MENEIKYYDQYDNEISFNEWKYLRDRNSDREDWLKIYCSVIEQMSEETRTAYTSDKVKNMPSLEKACVGRTNRLFDAFKERWAEE